MIILFPITRLERDKLRELTDDQIVTLAHVMDHGDEDIPVYPTTEEFLTDIDDQAIDPNAYWCVRVKKLYAVTYTVYGSHKHRVLCNTKEEADIIARHLRVPDTTITETYDGSPLTMNDQNSDVTIESITSYIKDTYTDTDPIQSQYARTPFIHSNTFSVTFTYETPLTGKTRCAVECKTKEEMEKVAHDANSVDGIKYVRTYPCKRPVGKNGVRMTSEDYWKMYGNK